MSNKSLISKTLLLLIFFLIGDFTIFGILKTGLDLYYGMNKATEVLCIGNSHSVAGIDARRLEKEMRIPVSKYATSGINTYDRFWMLRQFVETHPSVKVVIYDVDPRMFWPEDLSLASYTLLFPYIDDPVISHYLKQEASWQEYYTSRLLRTARFQDHTIVQALRGLLGNIEVEQSNIMQVENFQGYLERENLWSRKIRVNPESLEIFQNTIAYLTAKGIKVALVFIPLIDLVNEMDPDNQERVVTIFKKTASENKNVYFLDYNRDYQHNYALFYDPWHLNREGKELVTGRLIPDLQSLLSYN
jgi:protein-tyrosine-phosphatase